MKILVGILLLFFSCFLFAQKHQITNVKEEVVGDRIRVNYDLTGRYSSAYRIGLMYSLDNGRIFTNIPQENLSGDVDSTVVPGDNKRIVWSVLEDRDELIGNVKFKVTSEVKIHPEVESLTTSLLVASGGLGLLITGIGLEINAKKRWRQYDDVKDPTNELYANCSRQEYYDKANKQHHKAYVLNVFGAIAMLGGGFKLIKKMKKNRMLESKYKFKLLENTASSTLLQPQISWSIDENNKMYPEFLLTLKF